MKVRRLSGILAGLILFGMASPVQASLTYIGFAIYDDGVGDAAAYRMIYDDDMRLTWLDYVSAIDNWNFQSWWASSLNLDPENPKYFFVEGYSFEAGKKWRLPSVSEYTHLCTIEGVDINHPGPFLNLPEECVYSCDRYIEYLFALNAVYIFSFEQRESRVFWYYPGLGPFGAMVVRPGAVTASPSIEYLLPLLLLDK